MQPGTPQETHSLLVEFKKYPSLALHTEQAVKLKHSTQFGIGQVVQRSCAGSKKVAFGHVHVFI